MSKENGKFNNQLQEVLKPYISENKIDRGILDACELEQISHFRLSS
jgi:hypothetical protein